MTFSWQPYWHSRNTREKRLLLVMAALLPILFGWYGIWQPLQSAIADKQQRMVNYQQTLQLLAQAQSQKQFGISAAQNSDSSVESLISQSVKNANLTLQRLDPQGESATVQLGVVSFERLLAWLIMLDQRYHIRVEALDLQGDGKSQGNIVVKKLVLRREA